MYRRSMRRSRSARLAPRCRAATPLSIRAETHAAAEVASKRLLVVVADHDDRARAVGWATEAPEGVVPRVRARDAERAAVACDRARLAVVARIDDRGRALGRRQFVPHPRDGRGEGGPADRLDRVLVDVGNRRRMHVLDRHERQRDQRRDRGRQGDRDPERELPTSPASQPAFGDHAAGAEQDEQQTHRVVRLRSRHERDREQHEVREAERTVRPSLGRRSSHQRPPSHSGARSGPIKQKLERQKLHAVPDRLLLARSWRRARVGASRGEPARGGSAATARRRVRLRPTARGCGPDPSGARGGNRTREPRRGEARGACSPVRCRRPGRRAATVARPRRRGSGPPCTPASPRTGTSKVVVESRCPTAIAAADAAVASAATACPARPAPSSRAISATSTTTSAMATADTIRSPRGSAAEHPLREAAEQRRQGRLVVVPPGRMPGRNAEVQLVAVVAVPVRRRNEQQQLGGRDRKHERPGDSRSPTTHGRPTVSRRLALEPGGS